MLNIYQHSTGCAGQMQDVPRGYIHYEGKPAPLGVWGGDGGPGNNPKR